VAFLANAVKHCLHLAVVPLPNEDVFNYTVWIGTHCVGNNTWLELKWHFYLKFFQLDTIWHNPLTLTPSRLWLVQDRPVQRPAGRGSTICDRLEANIAPRWNWRTRPCDLRRHERFIGGRRSLLGRRHGRYWRRDAAGKRYPRRRAIRGRVRSGGAGRHGRVWRVYLFHTFPLRRRRHCCDVSVISRLDQHLISSAKQQRHLNNRIVN